MKLPIHNPARPIGGRRKKKTSRARARRSEENTMAKKKKRKKARRSNARRSTASKATRKKRRHSNPGHAHASSGKRHGKRRRRNPDSGGKKPSVGKLALAAGAGIAAVVGISVVGMLVAPDSAAAHYGLAAAGAIGGAVIAKKNPAVGGAIVAGSAAAVLAPAATQLVFNQLAPSKGAPTTTGAIHRRMNAIHRRPLMGAMRPGMSPHHAATPFGAATS